MKTKIKVLPEEIRGKIAAGEVIERPASVLKELLENAFDAKAKTFKIEFYKGGLEKIVVYDDGEGMPPEDLKLCFLPFATSKINSLSDIYNLQTYGFRGEALASIAQVSRLKIVSKEKNEVLPYEILVEFGKLKTFKPSNLKEGTLVEVKDLFENLPARRAFLKSVKTERAKNLEIIRALMLSHPEKSFFLKVDEEELISWKGGTLKELFSYLYEFPLENIFESFYKDGPYKIVLLLTDRTLTFSHGRFLYLFVNNRLIKDDRLLKVVYYLFKKFYGNLGLPAGVIKIDSPSHLIDFNVHPAKWEVRFKREKDIWEHLEKALTSHYKIQRGCSYRERPFSKENSYTHIVKEDLPLDYLKKSSFSSNEVLNPSLLKEDTSANFKIIGSFLNTYILVERGEDLYIIDQHALAERLHYEDLLLKGFQNLPQKLLLPFLIKLTSEMIENLERKVEILRNLGFELEVVGKEELLVKGVPSELNEEAQEVLESLLAEPFSDYHEVRTKFLKEIACKVARKKGDILATEEKYYLLKKMFEKNLETCPHNRPIFFKITLYEIEKKLKRKL